MTTTYEKENNVIRVVMEFMNYEKPTVASVIRSLFDDYRRNFGAVRFERDIIATEDSRNRFYTEFYIKPEDVHELEALLEAEA